MNVMLGQVRVRLLPFLTYRVRDAAEAEDLTQESLLKISRSLPAVTATTGTQFLAWCYAVASNVLLDWKRGRQTDPLYLGKSLEAEASIPFGEQGLEPVQSPRNQWLTATMREVLALVPLESLLLLHMRLERSLAWAEIGDEFGIAASAAKRRFQRMQRRLKGEILCRVYLLPAAERQRILQRLFPPA